MQASQYASRWVTQSIAKQSSPLGSEMDVDARFFSKANLPRFHRARIEWHRSSPNAGAGSASWSRRCCGDFGRHCWFSGCRSWLLRGSHGRRGSRRHGGRRCCRGRSCLRRACRAWLSAVVPMRGVTRGRSLASVFKRLSSLSDALTDGSCSGLGPMFDGPSGGFRAMFNRLPGLFHRVLIVLSKAKRKR